MAFSCTLLYCIIYITTPVCVHHVPVFYLLRTAVYPSTPIEGQYGFTTIITLVAQIFPAVDQGSDPLRCYVEL